MKPRLIINGTSLSEPGTMGGNTKIVVETIRHLGRDYEVHVILPEGKVKTIGRAHV